VINYNLRLNLIDQTDTHTNHNKSRPNAEWSSNRTPLYFGNTCTPVHQWPNDGVAAASSDGGPIGIGGHPYELTYYEEDYGIDGGKDL